MPNKRIAVYARVSTVSQSLDAQLVELETYVKAFCAGSNINWFKDVATGTTMARPAMDELMALILKGKIDCVIVWRLDRLGRTAAGLTRLFEELFHRKINLISLKDGLDLSTPAGRLMGNVLASVASYENEVRKERQALGISRAKELKKYPGGQRGRKWQITKDSEGAVKKLREAGQSISAIARLTKLSRPTIYKILVADKELPSAAMSDK